MLANKTNIALSILATFGIVFGIVFVIVVVVELSKGKRLAADDNSVFNRALSDTEKGGWLGADEEYEDSENLGSEGSTVYLPGENVAPSGLTRYDFYTNPENRSLKEFQPKQNTPAAATQGQKNALKMYLGATSDSGYPELPTFITGEYIPSNQASAMGINNVEKISEKWNAERRV